MIVWRPMLCYQAMATMARSSHARSRLGAPSGSIICGTSLARPPRCDGHDADGLVEPLSYDASTIDDRGVLLGLDLPISTAPTDSNFFLSKGDDEYAAFY